jgi:alpha-galactosidase
VSRKPVGIVAVVLAAVFVGLVPALGSEGEGGSSHHPVVAARPPMGWSSWSSLRGRIDEATIEAEAQAMHDQLKRHGYVYVNIDSGWTDHFDGFGRATWNATKFPDGIPAVAAFVHHLGLKLGIYLLPGIYKSVVAANTPILGTPFHAADIADTTHEGNTVGTGDHAAWRIDYGRPGAASYVQSQADLYASWGVDYIKMDFVAPGGGRVTQGVDDQADIEHWHYALQNTGRPIHLELSNSMSFAAAGTWKAFSNGWRIEGDVECYSRCPGVLTSFDKRIALRFADVPKWIPYAGPGGWNDLDSLEVGNGAREGLTPDERVTTMTLWSIEAAPLLLGIDLRSLDPDDLKLLTNDEVIAVDQAGLPAQPISQATPQQAWFSKERRGRFVVALFNLDATESAVSVDFADLGLTQAASVRDLWSHRRVASNVHRFSATLAPHASRLLRVSPQDD